MAITTSAGLTFEYEDGTTRNMTFNDIDASTIGGLKDRAIALNATIADPTTGAAYKETFVSDGGSPVVRISKAKYTMTEETVIYRG